MTNFKIRVRIQGTTIQAFYVEAENVSEATSKATEGIDYKSIVSVSVVK